MAPDLGLDLKLSTSKFITNSSKEAPPIQDEDRRIAKLEERIRSFEQERRKIEAFKRELPVCLFLLDDVIDRLKKELEQCRGERRHVLEEFLPVKSKLDGKGAAEMEKDCQDMMNWMSSAQLWSDHCSADDTNKNHKKNIKSADESESKQKKKKSLSDAFVPFKGSPAVSCSLRIQGGKVAGGLPDLSLASPPVSVVPEDHRPDFVITTATKPVAGCQGSYPTSSNVSLRQQVTRKARRSWSMELHRRFMVALQQLGGAQVATPKLIRELMKVNGLTNDEVKSHLQKYRLNMQKEPRPRSLSQTIVVIGGAWAPPDRRSGSQHSGSLSGSSQVPLQSQDFTTSDSSEDDDMSESFELEMNSALL